MPHVLTKDLRNAVLQAAMSGKLTKPEPNDGNIAIQGITNDFNEPFDIPDHWKYVYLGDVFNIRSSTRVHQSDWRSKGVPFYRAREVVKLSDQGFVNNELFIDEKLYKKFADTSGVPKPGDLLVSGVGTLGATYIVKDDDKFYYKDASVLCFENVNNQNPYFMKYLMTAPYMVNQIYDPSAFGTTVATLTMKRANKFIVALPSVEEQARIVARLDELMAKIDEYEKIENELTALHKKFPTDMKAAILQAAMQGKLSEQLSSDENVNEYYSNIQAHRTQLIKEKVLKKENCLKEPIKDIPFDIPETWMWCHLGDCIQLISGADLTPDEYNDKQHGIVYLTGASNIENGRIIINRWTETPRSIAKKGDLLLTCKGTVGKTCFLEIDEAHIARQIMAIRAIDINPQYMAAFIAYYVGKLQSMAKSMIPGIERANVLTAVFPLPPIEEQQRIVEKLDQLLPLCDQLADMAS